MRVLAAEPNKNMNTNLSKDAFTAIAVRIFYNIGMVQILPVVTRKSGVLVMIVRARPRRVLI